MFGSLVQAIGKLKLLPASTLAAIGAAREATAGYNGMVLTIAVAYGGREEIADAIQALPYEEMRKGTTLCRANSYTDSYAAFFGRFFGFVHPGEISSSR